MRYTISFILDGEDYYCDTNNRNTALALYSIVKEKNVKELKVYDCKDEIIFQTLTKNIIQ